MDSGFARLVTLLVLSRCALGYFPNTLDRCHSSDASHEYITATALTAVAKTMVGEKYDLKGDVGFREALRTIIDANVDVDLTESTRAASHFNGDELFATNEELADLKALIVQLVRTSGNNDYSLIRGLMGRHAHMLQDFYSNTNWVEYYRIHTKSRIYADLGVKGTPILTPDQPCISDSASGANMNNILHPLRPFKLTSGYRSGQDVQKPPATGSHDGKLLGKCSHGGRWDASATWIAPTGGINKESSDSSLSPHRSFHEASSESAILATAAFFNDAAHGLIKSIGRDEASKLLGLLPTTILTLITALRASWLPSIIQPMAASLLPEQGSALFGGVALTCQSTQQEILRTDSDLEKALQASLSASVSPVMDGPSMTDCLLTAPDHSVLAAIFDASFHLGSMQEIEALKEISLLRSIRMFLFINSVTAANLLPSFIKTLQQQCRQTGGDLYEFMDADDLLTLISHLPLRSFLSSTEATPGKAAPLLPGQTLYVETSCREAGTTGGQVTQKTPATTTQDIWVTRHSSLQLVNNTGDKVALLSFSNDANCSKRFLQSIATKLEIELYTRGPYDRLFPAGLVLSGDKVTAVVKSDKALPQPSQIRMNGKSGTEDSKALISNLTACPIRHATTRSIYTADIDPNEKISSITVMSVDGVESLTVPVTMTSLKTYGPSYITATQNLTISNYGRGPVNVELRVMAARGQLPALVLSQSAIQLEANWSTTVQMQIAGGMAAELANCLSQQQAAVHNCSCNLRTRVAVIVVLATDEIGITTRHMVKTAIIDCINAVESESTTLTEGFVSSTEKNPTTSSSFTVSTALPAVPFTELSAEHPGMDTSIASQRSEADGSSGWTTASATAAMATTTKMTATVVLPQVTTAAPTSTAPTPGSATPTPSASPAPASTDILMPTTPQQGAGGMSQTELFKLLCIAIFGTIGFLAACILSCGGILYLRRMLQKKPHVHRRLPNPVYDEEEAQWLQAP